MTDQPHSLLQAGAYSIPITPVVGARLQGYELRFADGVTDPLFACALAVGIKGVVEWILLSVDCLGLDRSFVAHVRNSIATRLRMLPSAITVVCSHTHSGPATLSNIGPVCADHEYLHFLEERLIEVAAAAADRLQSVRWRFGVTLFAENVNRRLPTRRGITLGANPDGPVDRRLRVIRIDRVEGPHLKVPLALIAHYACHATLSRDTPLVSADWPGAMRTGLQQLYGRDGIIPVVCFLQGCAGNVTHRIGVDKDAWPEHFLHKTATQVQILGRLATAAATVASEKSVDFAAENVRIGLRPVLLPFRGLGSEQSEVQVVRIGVSPQEQHGSGNALWFVGLPGEPFSEYSAALGRTFKRYFRATSDRTLVSGYTNDCVGYLCTQRALREGGYEVDVAPEVFHRPAPFTAQAEVNLLAASLETAKSLLDPALAARKVTDRNFTLSAHRTALALVSLLRRAK